MKVQEKFGANKFMPFKLPQRNTSTHIIHTILQSAACDNNMEGFVFIEGATGETIEGGSVQFLVKCDETIRIMNEQSSGMMDIISVKDPSGIYLHKCIEFLITICIDRMYRCR